LGSQPDAEDAVQEAWIRLYRSSQNEIDNVGGWLTTVVARICLDTLRARKTRSEEPISDRATAPAETVDDHLQLAEAIGLAMVVVLEQLTASERVAFVLHDMFDLSFDEIGSILGRSSVATRQLASRARRRVRGISPTAQTDLKRRSELVDAFRAASREGNLQALLAVLAPDVVVRADAMAVKLGATAEVRGVNAVVETFVGRAQGAQRVLVDGMAGLAWAPGGRLRVVFDFVIRDGRIAEINLLGNPERIGSMQVTFLD